MMVDVLRNADIVLNPVKWKDFVYDNPRAIIGKFHSFKYHWMKWCYPYIFKNMDYRTICALFGVGYVSWWGRVNNVMMKIIKKIDKRKKKSIINNRLKRLWTNESRNSDIS